MATYRKNRTKALRYAEMREPEWSIVPPITLTPGSFVTGIDSPVTIAASSTVVKMSIAGEE